MTTNEAPAGGSGRDLEAAIAASLDDADADEAAAVAVAIGAHIRDLEQRAAVVAAESATDAGWTGRKWAYADRLDRRSGRTVGVTDETPRDPWTAAGRADRL